MNRHVVGQVWRVARLFLVTFVTILVAGGSVDKSAVVGAVVGAVEAVYRQVRKVAPADPAAGKSLP